MFDNIGAKIKSLASVFFGILATLSVILGFIVMFAVMVAADGFGGFLGGLLGGVVVGSIGFLVSWISCFVLYGFGELVDSTSEIKKALVKNESTESTYRSEERTYEQSPVDKSSAENDALKVLNELKEKGIIEEIDYQERVDSLKNNQK